MKSFTKFFSATLWMSAGILFLSVGLFLVSCESAGSDDPPPPPALTLTATELVRSSVTEHGLAYDSHRVHHVLFSLQDTVSADYTIVAKLASEAAPTEAEINAASGKFSVSASTTAVNVYLSYPITATFDDGDITSDLLAPNTTYTIYAMDSDGTVGSSLIDISTDAVPTGLTDNQMYGGIPTDYTNFVTKTDNPMVFYGRGTTFSSTIDYESTGITDTLSSCDIAGDSCDPPVSADDGNYSFSASDAEKLAVMRANPIGNRGNPVTVTVKVTGGASLTFPFTYQDLAPPLTAVSAGEIARNNTLAFAGNTVDNRIRFTLLSVSASNAGSYTLGLRASSEEGPSASGLTSAGGVIVRSLDTTAINVMLGFHMDASIFAADSNFDFAAFSADGSGSADVLASALQASTDYTLYATKSDGSSTVQEVMTLTTDAIPTTTTFSSQPINEDSNGGEITYTIRAEDPFMYNTIHVLAVPLLTFDVYLYSDGAVDDVAGFSFDIATGGGPNGAPQEYGRMLLNPLSLFLLWPSLTSTQHLGGSQTSVGIEAATYRVNFTVVQ